MTSPHLQHWTRLENVTGDKRREARVNLCWKNMFWLFVDEWRGLGVYQSDDGIKLKICAWQETRCEWVR